MTMLLNFWSLLHCNTTMQQAMLKTVLEGKDTEIEPGTAVKSPCMVKMLTGVPVTETNTESQY